MEKQQDTISEKTLIPLSLVITIVGLVVGGIYWLTDIYAIASETRVKVKTNSMAIAEIKGKFEKLDEVSERLSRIEGKLDAVIYQTKNK